MPVASAAPTCTSSAASSPNPSSTGPRPPDLRYGAGAWPRRHPLPPGQRVGVPWLGWTCGRCRFCASGRENLCDRARFTGYTIDGGFAEETLADARSWFMVPEGYPDLQAALLLCAGLIGYRSLRLTGDATLLGLYGFGPRSTASARSPAGRADACLPSPVPGDSQGQAFARSLGAEAAPGRRVPVEGRHGEQCSPTRR
jgi:alcohol dehydrogenase, propanol-preferring